MILVIGPVQLKLAKLGGNLIRTLVNCIIYVACSVGFMKLFERNEAHCNVALS